MTAETTTLTVTITADARPAVYAINRAQRSIDRLRMGSDSYLRRNSYEMLTLKLAVWDRHYVPAVMARARWLIDETGLAPWRAYLKVRTELAQGTWRPRLDVPHEQAKLEALGRRIAATREAVAR